ncbi:carboxymuconolactone decarboxylase family protein [Actinomadura luteofluorescens]|uniref:carboxymuconolactone decarboxylase family protein n=1 Tax=Actinomadura luteofluorescens TaxID=46163 RepID=UPI003635E120
MDAAGRRARPAGAVPHPAPEPRAGVPHARARRRLLAHGRLPARDREIIIDRTCARTGCEYEWGVHAATFGEAAGLSREQLHATVSDDTAPWSPKERLLLSAADELHDSARISHRTWTALAEHYDEEQLLELLVLAGWYRTISQLINTLDLDNEPWAPTFPTPTTP